MKATLRLILISLTVARTWQVEAQTNLPWPPDPETHVIFDGKLQQFGSLDFVKPGQHGKGMFSYMVLFEAQTFLPEGIVFQGFVYNKFNHEKENQERILVKNYPNSQLATGELMDGLITMVKTGVFQLKGEQLIVYDCGLRDTVENRKKVGLVNDVQLAAYEQAAKLSAEKRAAVLADKNQAAEVRAFQSLLSMATNGSASAQCSVGLRYLNGKGVETNKTLAIEWLNKSAAQGDTVASNMLITVYKHCPNDEANSVVSDPPNAPSLPIISSNTPNKLKSTAVVNRKENPELATIQLQLNEIREKLRQLNKQQNDYMLLARARREAHQTDADVQANIKNLKYSIDPLVKRGRELESQYRLKKTELAVHAQ